MSDSKPPVKSGAALYLLGALLLAAGIGGIVLLTQDDAAKPLPPAAPTVVDEPMMNAPPPPPPPKKTAEAEDAGDDAGDEDAAPTSTGAPRVASGGGGSCSKCGQGKSNSALQSSLQGAAGAARGCYNRAINRDGAAAEGKMTVAVNVGSTGAVCNASIVNDSVGSPTVSNCVLKQFQGKSFPKPDEGCVTVNIPLNFAVKKAG